MFLYSMYTNTEKSEIFHVFHDKDALLTRRCSEHGKIDREQRLLNLLINIFLDA